MNGVNSVSEALATQHHCALCFDALINELKGDPKGVTAEANFPDAYCGVFVTWDKRCERTDSYAMRGCIGSLQPKSLQACIKEFSLKSALEDRRFEPIWAEEIPLLSCSVSLLFRFEEAQDWLDWEIGVHGLILYVYDELRQLNTSATFLPNVVAENRWTQEETVKKLIRKSGCRAAITEELLSTIRLTRYRSTLASLTYDEYQKLKYGSTDDDL